MFELNNDIFVISPDGVDHRLTGAEWAAAGYPKPELLYNAGYVQLSWSGDILFLDDAARGVGYPLSFSEWRDDGFPTPLVVTRVANDRVYKKENSNDIYYEGGGLTKKLTLGEYQRMGSPRPQIV